MTLTIKYGLQKAVRSYPTPPSVAEVKADRSLRGELGYTDNVRVLVASVEQPDTNLLAVDEVEIENAANRKA